MRVAVLGGSGFIGRHLQQALERRGDAVVQASLRDPQAGANAVRDCDVIVNLAGEPIAQRWTAAAKRAIVESRTVAPRAMLAALAAAPFRPSAYISASAVGYYGTSETRTFAEDDGPGNGFLAETCAAWEQEAQRAEGLGMRVAVIRTGVVLANDGGALQKMLPPFRLGLGGKIGTGSQWFSWIHSDDAVGIYLLAVDGASGILNATSPHPQTNETVTSALGRALHRPTILPAPAFVLRAMLGEGADVLLEGQRVVPARTEALGYRFRFPALEDALADLVGAA